MTLDPKFVQDPIVRSVINSFVGKHEVAISDLSDVLARHLATQSGMCAMPRCHIVHVQRVMSNVCSCT